MNPAPHAPIAGEDLSTGLAFVKTVIQRTVLSPEHHESFMQQVFFIEARQREDLLHLAVLGEFSSGKSTFINAMLRMPLLKSAHQATTAAATLIHYGDEFMLKVEFADGARITATGADHAAMRAKLATILPRVPGTLAIGDLVQLVTADAAVSAQVRNVDIILPSEPLKNHLCIVDTPGIGAGAENAHFHEAVTERVAAEIADAAVFLIPADNPMTRGFIAFLSERAQRFLHRSIFVITKMDHIQEKDRPVIREFVETRLKELVGAKPLVLEAAAATMLSVRRMLPHLEEVWTYWQAEFRKMEETIHGALLRNRSLILTERFLVLLQSLLVDLQSSVSARREVLEQERKLLKENSVATLDAVLGKLLEKSNQQIEAESVRCLNGITVAGGSFEASAKQAARDLLGGADKSNIANVLRTGIPTQINRLQTEFDTSVQAFIGRLASKCEEVQRLFNEEFEQCYRNLRAVGRRIELPKYAPISRVLNKGAFTAAQSFIDSSQSTKATVGAVGGAAVGCFAGIAGGVFGLIVGLIVGMMASRDPGGIAACTVGGFFVGYAATFIMTTVKGAQFGKTVGSISRQRAEILARLDPAIAAHVKKAADGRRHEFDKAKIAALSALNEMVKTHMSLYSNTVNQLMTDHRNKMTRLAAEQEQVEADSRELLARRAVLEERRRQLAGVAL